jgi:phenylalanyl-tRNA synthetase alpha chain
MNAGSPNELLAAIQADALARIAAVTTVEELRSLSQEVLGKRSELVGLRKQLGGLDEATRKSAGESLNATTRAIQAALDDREAGLARSERAARYEAERLDLTEVVDPPTVGHLHVVTQTWQALEDIFVGMGYAIAEGPEIETDWYNFEALNIPDSHPARSMWDTLWVDVDDANGNPMLLRTHTSNVQIHVMQNAAPPIYIVAPGRTYRRDTTDATHLPVFHQIEGLVVDKGITMADLSGTIQAFTQAYFGQDFESRLRPSYFPFTEPSAEFDIRPPGGDWLELGGCGMVHPNVFRHVGIDPEVWTGFAFGFGIDRLAKVRYEVDDLREFISSDIRFLEQF